VHGLAQSLVTLAALDLLKDGSKAAGLARDAEERLLKSHGGELMLGRSQLVTLAMSRSLQNQPESAWRTLKAAVDRGENTVNRFDRHRSVAFRSIAGDPQLGPQLDELCRHLKARLGLD